MSLRREFGRRGFVAKLRGFLRGPRRDPEFEEEIQGHLQLLAERFVAQGMSREEAEAAARRQFGNVTLLHEDRREMQTLPWIEALWHDLRYALRTLAKDRRFTILAVLALALGIGSTTVIFSAFYGVILNTFAFKEADQVTAFYIVDQDRPENRRPSLTLPELVYYRDHNHVFQDMSGEFGGFGGTPLRYTTGGSTYQFDGAYLSATSFDLFGMKPLLGRLPNENDVKPGATPVFVIGAKLWREHFNSDPNLVGESFTLNGVPRTLVGIMPPRFRWAWVDAWLPFSLDPNEIATNPELKGKMAYVVGRLKPRATVEQAAADLNLVAHQYAHIEPRLYPKRFTVTAKRSSEEAVEGLGFSALLYPLMGAVGLLLLIACANVANLLLARATVRAREIAVRSALGASRWRLLEQFLVESLCLALGGCAAGCLLAFAGIKLLGPLIPYNAFPQEAVIALNWQVLLFSVAMAVLCTVISGMAPAIHALRTDLRAKLSSTGTGTNPAAAHGKLRSGLVVAEVALSVILLVSAGLMMRSVLRLQHIDLGINTKNLLYAGLSFPVTIRQTPEAEALAFDRFFAKLRVLPGIMAVSTTIAQPPFGGVSSDTILPGKVHTERWMTSLDLCNEDYLATMPLQLRLGRFLSSSDVLGTRRVAVVSQAFVDQYLAREDPIGRSVRFSLLDQFPDLKDKDFEIVGVVANTRNRGLRLPPMPQAYLPHTLVSIGATSFVARTAVKPESLIPQIQQIVWDVDPNVALIDATGIDAWLHKFIFANPEFEFIMLTSFASTGLLLVLIGIFGVMAYTVALQTREIGIRMALGAARHKIVQIVLRKGLALIAAGLVIGLAGSLGATRIIASGLAGVQALDPWTYAGVLALMVAAGSVACLVPARRAAKVDPMEAIRCE